MKKYDYYDDDYEYEDDYEEENEVVPVLSFISNCFIYIGVIIAIILLIYFIVKGNILTAALYIIGLIIAFFFGYAFMYCLDHFIDHS